MNVTMKVQAVILFVLGAFAFSGCDIGGGGGATTYAIGDFGPSGVGIVFYITDGGLHGLEAAPEDQSASQVWIEGGSTQNTLNGNTSVAIGTGLANSNAITAQDGHIGSAAQVCRNYNGGGLDDWFLPSKEELDQLFLQRDTVGGFADGYYWSSSEGNSSEAWDQWWPTGSQITSNKNSGDRVRAVRAF